jgi:threonine/homoserine/homoserine lactone efflux protein
VATQSVLALLLFLLPLAYSPGPGNAFFAAIGASAGVRASVPALVGYHVATLAVTILIGAGMGATVLTNPVAAKVLAAAGSAYVLWLAWLFIRSARSKGADPDTPVRERRIGFWSGAVVMLLNPKAYYIIAVMFAQFLRPPVNDDPTAVLAIALVFTINNLVAFLVWVVAGRALTAVFRSERAKRRIDYLFAATLIVVAIWMAHEVFA